MLCLALPLQAQQPMIRGLTVVPQGERLAAHVQLENLFAPKIISTIRSGLPALVQHDFRLQAANNKERARALQTVEVKYDIWAQRFRLTFPDTVRVVTTFAEVEQIFADFTLPLLFVNAARAEAGAYALRLRVAVFPISAEQGRQLLQRLAVNDVETENTSTAAGRSGFSLNVSCLLSFFFAGEENAHGASAWAVSPAFQWTRQP